ncbi:PEP-CTERM sorting domain-containing protein [Gemmatimonas groenlandica]|uniref:PEP-CTERM sorting domain-containing protein n=1 Tax=Gemmatimonas groenlandica TaxID=2732249 RepID=A0A6M4IU18_9BACT|nr:PEP-CTERM sorting domain-containing protein [Gemmatimonas groenlandica]QJR36352.1 PEP-CTERM sorting domain-containing protein [Gemmatimonas groenlandica]
MIRSTRALAVPFALLAALSTVATRAQAQVTTWSDRTAFVNAVGAVTTENFLDNAAFPLGSTLNSTSSYNEGTWAQVLPGNIKAGVTYSVSSGPLLIDGGGGFEGGFLDGIFNNYGTVGPLTATFNGAVKGFGFLTNNLMGSRFDVIIAFRNGSTSNQLGINNENGLQFFGFSSANQDIASVTIGGNDQTFNFVVDDFTFSANAMPSTSVPEPSTFALMAAGGLVMAGVARRRNRA